jgi:hypothetical protein
VRCGDAAECLTEHIARALANAKPARKGDKLPVGAKRGALSIRADCPACERHDCLTVSVGDFLRFVWTCHAGCTRPDIRAAMVSKAKIRETCLPRAKTAPKRQLQAQRTNAEIVRQLRALLDEPVNGSAYRMRAAMLLLNVDAKAAADYLGIPERTRRRLLCP